jgi:hypothetical protein
MNYTDFFLIHNYYPWHHQGISMRMAAQIDPDRLYKHPAILKLSGIGIFPVFDFDLPIDNYYGEYLVLWVGEDILDATMDYNVLISLN